MKVLTPLLTTSGDTVSRSQALSGITTQSRIHQFHHIDSNFLKMHSNIELSFSLGLPLGNLCIVVCWDFEINTILTHSDYIPCHFKLLYLFTSTMLDEQFMLCFFFVFMLSPSPIISPTLFKIYLVCVSQSYSKTTFQTTRFIGIIVYLRNWWFIILYYSVSGT